MRYAVYFTWNDGTEDTFNCDSALERNMNIQNMINRDEFKYIAWCKIYASGEYGKLTVEFEREKGKTLREFIDRYEGFDFVNGKMIIVKNNRPQICTGQWQYLLYKHLGDKVADWTHDKNTIVICLK